MAQPPAPNNPQNNAQNQAASLIDKFKALPKAGQYGLMGVFAVLIFLVVFRGGGNNRPAPVAQAPASQTNVNAISDIPNNISPDDARFAGLAVERPELLQSWLQQQQNALNSIQDNLEDRFVDLETEKETDRAELEDLRGEIRQMIQTFQSEIRNLEDANNRDREVLSELAEETRRLQLQAPVQQSAGAAALPQQRPARISQTPLGGGGQGFSVAGSAPLSGAINAVRGINNRATLTGKPIGGTSTVRSTSSGADTSTPPEQEYPKQPFIPPLGFVKGTLLNGVDALAGGGISTPALVRLAGKYKSAMNTTVNLNGCFVLVEFEGDISTERALGRPSQMTCVYPDQGAVTYNVSGYAVDTQDGIIGVPGVFFEGNAGRLALAMSADFVAGIADIITQNQQTNTVNTDGTVTSTITGDEAKAEIAGGLNSGVQSLRDYLFERANRVLPFIRLDATREIHLVFLSGTGLRESADQWTKVYDANSAP